MRGWYYCSATSITSRPLYCPQLGQARCGSFGSWQFGHSAFTAGLSASWERRAEVRRFEWRRLGFGIFFSLRFQILERRPPVIGRATAASAVNLIAVLAADRANALAGLATDVLHRERQNNVLP
jgi:hypothetical protein